jgi:tight adherence protein B
MNPIVLLIGIGIAAMVAAIMFLFSKDDDKTNERFGALVGGTKRPKSNPGGSLVRMDAFDTDAKTLLQQITPNIPSLRKVFEQADCNIAPSALFGMSLLLLAVGTTFSLFIPRVPTFAAPFMGLIFSTFPWLWLWNKRKARLKTFENQLPDALELLARALRSGQSLAAGFQVIAEEMPSPICDEFNRVFQEQNMGITIEDALRSMSERVANLDFRFFVTSVAIQRQTGGDLAEILDKIGHIIRERFKILGTIQALTGEGRLSGYVLVSLPIFMFFVLLYINPEYVKPLWEHPLGRKMSAVGIVMQIIGAYVIQRIVDIKV